jgi:phage terminase large subunit GpA-like protein
MDISVCSSEIIAERLARGLSSFGVPEPMSLDEWASAHFYLSAESSYVEQQWRAWPFQRAILACISNDDIEEVDWIKSARVGYTKSILAAIGYYAQHKRRNQALWQPTDDDRDEFAKTELDPMLRDVAIMQSVFPTYLSRHKDNTLQQKKFLGSMLHLRGGKAAKNYRRISVDIAYLDELDAFDNDIEKEGDPVSLASKRVEGATFPKLVLGSTPKLKGFSLIDTRSELADARFNYAIRCPHCGERHPLTWGGKEEPHGFKWTGRDPETVRHLCPHCGGLITQGDYLAVWDDGLWMTEDGALTLDHSGVFRDASGERVPAPRHVAFHVWTAYSPAASWDGIVREFLAAHAKSQEGDKTKLKAFWNTTLGLAWELDVEKTDAEELKARAEPFPLQRVPRGCLLLLAGVDTQDNRLEVTVWGYGRGCEMWTIDHKAFFGNPGEDAVWDDLEEFLFETEYQHASGQLVKIYGSAIDTGGHYTHAVYHFCHRHAGRRVFAVKGRSGREKHIKDGVQKVDIDWRGRTRKRGVLLWQVGTNHAKDLIYSRLQVTRPGPGYIHLSHELSDEFFKQMAGEVRAERQGASGRESRWAPIRKRVEAWDCTVYAVWLETHFELVKKTSKWWDMLEEKVQPRVLDLFAPAQPAPAAHGIPSNAGGQPPINPIHQPHRSSPRRLNRDW